MLLLVVYIQGRSQEIEVGGAINCAGGAEILKLFSIYPHFSLPASTTPCPFRSPLSYDSYILSLHLHFPFSLLPFLHPSHASSPYLPPCPALLGVSLPWNCNGALRHFLVNSICKKQPTLRSLSLTTLRCEKHTKRIGIIKQFYTGLYVYITV